MSKFRITATAIGLGLGITLMGTLVSHAALPNPTPNQSLTTGGIDVNLGGPQLGQISAGEYHTVALGSDQRMYAWGANFYGQLGTGSESQGPDPVPAPLPVRQGQIPSTTTIEQITAGGLFNVALGSDNQMYAWGSNNHGELGLDTAILSAAEPMLVRRGAIPNDAIITQVSAGFWHTVALDSLGNMYSWGENTSGKLGNGSEVESSEPVLVNRGDIPSAVRITQISAGSEHTIALGSNGKIYAWGNNSDGRLGDETTTDRAAPTEVKQGAIPINAVITEITTDYYHSLALDSSGQVYAWGDNARGELGIGNNNNNASNHIPVAINQGAIPTGVSIVQVTAGGYYSVALGSDGNAYSWGWNYYGQLGDGTQNPSNVPIRVTTGDKLEQDPFTLIATGLYHSVGYSADGKTYGWGSNSYGQLGFGESGDGPFGSGPAQNRFVPTQALLDQTVTEVYFGDTPATSFSRNADSTITAVAPEHVAGVVDVSVTWEINAAAQSTIVYPASFTYVDPVPVSISLTDPVDQTVDAGNRATFSVTTVDELTVTWEVSTNEGQTWSAITTEPNATPSADGLQLSVLGAESNNGYWYRAIGTNNSATVQTAAASLTVRIPSLPPAPPTPPVPQPGAVPTSSTPAHTQQKSVRAGLVNTGTNSENTAWLFGVFFVLGAGSVILYRTANQEHRKH